MLEVVLWLPLVCSYVCVIAYARTCTPEHADTYSEVKEGDSVIRQDIG